jgi:UDP-3-O-[3-hydroxymyristoyl] glucosamine N-acyltransferase
MGADPRFFERLGPLAVSELAAAAGADLVGDGEARVSDLTTPDQAGEGDAFFLTTSDVPYDVRGAVAISSQPDILERADGLAAALIHPDPRVAFASVGQRLYRLRRQSDASGWIAETAAIAEDVHLGPGVIIGEGAVIDAGCEIGAGAVIGPGVCVGSGSRIGSRAVLQCTLVGRNCEIYAGAVLGEAGFGLTPGANGLVSLPHYGRVILEDDVVIGALCTIDRGMLADTILRRNARIDNHCHIAHNVDVGSSVVMAAFAGISGSVTIGEGSQFGGRVGVADHLSIGKGASLAADAAVMRDVPEDESWAGSPAQPIRSFMRETAWIRRQVHGKASKRKKD